MKKNGPAPKFSPEEDHLLVKLVELFSPDSWKLIAEQFENKTAKQCRDRWINYANPKLRHGNWDLEEDVLILSKFKELGPKWSQMGILLPDRSSNDIRYRWIKLTGDNKEINDEILEEKRKLLNQATVVSDPDLDAIFKKVWDVEDEIGLIKPEFDNNPFDWVNNLI